MDHNGIPIKIRRQNRRNMMMRRTHAGIEVYIPHWMRRDSRVVRDFIAGGLKQLDKLPSPPDHTILTPAANIRRMVRTWARVMNLEPKRITLRTMYNKWGSCSSHDNITLNKALSYLPHHLVEYVVVHELVHMLVFNHGPQFREVMAHYLPDWEAREEELSAIRL